MKLPIQAKDRPEKEKDIYFLILSIHQGKELT